MYERMYRNRWIDSAYHVGYLKQIVNRQQQFIEHILRCAPDVCVYNADNHCATLTHLLDEIISTLESYENYVATGCPTETATDSERESEARARQGAARVGFNYNTVRQSDKDDDWFGGIV